MLYRLSRLSRLHEILRKAAYFVLGLIPLRWRYGIGRITRNGRLPYRLIDNGATVVQIGAPWDLLAMGRSRSMHFSYFVGKDGRVIIVEPDKTNIERLRSHISMFNINNVTIVPLGAWKERKTLRFLSDPAHPAANLVEDTFDDSRADRDRFIETEIEVDSLESILDREGADHIRLLSLTTNGSEVPIIEGLGKYLNKIDYLSVVGNKSDFDFLANLGFGYHGGDDRGYLYERTVTQQ